MRHTRVPVTYEGRAVGSADVYDDGKVEMTLDVNLSEEMVKLFDVGYSSALSIAPVIEPAYGIAGMGEDLLAQPIIHHRNQGKAYRLD